MTGNLKEADALFGKYAAALPREPAAYQLAQWQFLTGRKNAGIAGMKKLAAEPDRESQALARSPLAIWDLGTRDSNAPGSSEVAGPYRQLLAGKFREALPELEAAYRQANPSSDGQIRVLLAWALVETGSLDRAAKLIEMCPLPMSAGDARAASLIFPRYFALRAAVLEKQGKPDEAKKNRDLYLEYAGADAIK